jgi:hypothetical protein
MAGPRQRGQFSFSSQLIARTAGTSYGTANAAGVTFLQGCRHPHLFARTVGTARGLDS